jgi:hypothetical protein
MLTRDFLNFLRQRPDLDATSHSTRLSAATHPTSFTSPIEIYSHTKHHITASLQRSPPIPHTRFGASQWATVTAQVAAAAVVTMTATATKTLATTDRATATATATTVNSNTINTLRLLRRITTIRARRLALRPTANRDRHHPRTMTNLETPAEAASLSEAPLLADRTTDLSRTSLSTPLARGHQMVLRPSQRAPPTTGLGGLTETAGDPAMMGVEEVRVLRAVEEASAALARSQHMIALF